MEYLLFSFELKFFLIIGFFTESSYWLSTSFDKGELHTLHTYFIYILYIYIFTYKSVYLYRWYKCCCLVAKWCPTLLWPRSLPGCSSHGISQARMLERVVISFSRGSSWPRDGTHVSCFGRWVLYHWATRQAWYKHNHYIIICDTHMIYIGIRSDDLSKLIENNTHKIQLYRTMYVLMYQYTYTVAVYLGQPSPRKRNAKRQNGCLRRS